MSAYTVIGVGNRLRADDAIGPLLIDELKKQDLKEVELVDAGMDALGILEFLENRDKVLIIDACRMGRSPGDLVLFMANEAEVMMEPDQISLHGLGLAEALKMAGSLEMLPRALKIIGIEPLSVELNGEISKPVKEAMTLAMDLILKEVLDSQEHRGY